MTNEKMKELYQAGSVVYSKLDPSIKLSVLNYSKGIYYCAVIGNAQKHNLPFLESQLGAAENKIAMVNSELPGKSA